MRSQVGCSNTQRQALAGSEGTRLGDAIRDVDQAGEGEGKRRIDHQRDGEREGEHMRISGRQDV